MTKMSMWTIYDHPLDYPDSFVARRFEIGKSHKATTDVLTAPTLDMLRAKLPREFSACLSRDPNDEPAIVETWL